MIRLPIFVAMILQFMSPQIACADPISANSIAVVDSDTIDAALSYGRLRHAGNCHATASRHRRLKGVGHAGERTVH